VPVLLLTPTPTKNAHKGLYYARAYILVLAQSEYTPIVSPPQPPTSGAPTGRAMHCP
jgi:hypothetical protein